MSKKAKKWSIGIILLSLIIFIGFKMFGTTNNAIKINYVEHIVSKGNISIQILSTGIIQPQNKVEIKPPIAGRVEKVLVKEGDRVKKGQIIAWMSSTERAAMLDAASSKGIKELREWEEMYRATPILAAIDGTIIQKNIESGQTFTTADPILVMSDRLTVKAQVDETDISKIKLKEKALITLDAYPEHRIDAIVDQIAFDATTINNVTTYIVDVLPKKTPDYMRSGMTANVVFDVESRKDIVVVPTEAIKTEGDKNTVLMKKIEDNETIVEREVILGISDGKKSEILNGLNVGDKIMLQEFKISTKTKTGTNPFAPSRPGRGR